MAPIDTGPTAKGPASPGSGTAWWREQVEATRIARGANDVRKRIGVLAVDPNREMKHRPGVSPSRFPYDGSSFDPCADFNQDKGEERNRRTQSTPVVDRHREHPGDASRKSYDSLPTGPDRGTESRGQIEAPVSRVDTGRCVRAHDPPGYRRLQAEEDDQFHKHVNLFARRRSKLSTRHCQENPLHSRPSQRMRPLTSSVRNPKEPA